MAHERARMLGKILHGTAYTISCNQLGKYSMSYRPSRQLDTLCWGKICSIESRDVC